MYRQLITVVLLFCLVVVIGGLYLAKLMQEGSKTSATQYRYEARATLLTVAEQRFWEALVDAVGPQGVVCPKVRIADVVKCSGPAFGRVSQKHVDFVVVEARSSKIRFVVELDDSTHQREKTKERDAVVNDVMRAAGVPIYRIRASASYDVALLRDGVGLP